MSKEYEILDNTLYPKIFNFPYKLIYINLPIEINEEILNRMFGETDENGWLIIYKKDGLNIPLRIVGNILTTYEQYMSQARYFIMSQLLGVDEKTEEKRRKDNDEVVLNPSINDLPLNE